MATSSPPLRHRLFFWFTLATLSQVLPEVMTLNTPIPWTSSMGWLLGYPVYGLHVLALAGLLYRWPLGGYATLVAYGGLFGLYEGYLTKQLWNPNWAADVTANIGGVRLFHTISLVFFLHPILSFVLPLVLTERLLVTPGRLTELLPRQLRGGRGTVLLLVGVAVYLGILIGSNLPDRNALEIPLASVAVLTSLGLVWRLVLKGHRYQMEDLLPRGRWLGVVVGLLFVSYPVYTVFLRWDALPIDVVPHLLVAVIYTFLVVTIVALTRNASPVAVRGRSGWTHAQAAALAGVGFGVFLFVAWLHAPVTQPGQTIAILTFLGFGVLNAVVLGFALGRAVWRDVCSGS